MKLSEIKVSILNPNTYEVTSESYKVNREEDESLIIRSVCANKYLRSLNDKNDDQKLLAIEISKAFNVLHPTTSIIAKLKLSNVSQNEM